VNVIKVVIVVVCAFIEKVIVFLNKLSKDYSAVSVKLRDEKEAYKQRARVRGHSFYWIYRSKDAIDS